MGGRHMRRIHFS
ncbi:hypothetical protein GQ600_9978 [Phytophthora cactorum]|nr:hypothetical protein GQ600_9978 [Phytophthora cactorum]